MVLNEHFSSTTTVDVCDGLNHTSGEFRKMITGNGKSVSCYVIIEKSSKAITSPPVDVKGSFFFQCRVYITGKEGGDGVVFKSSRQGVEGIHSSNFV